MTSTVVRHVEVIDVAKAVTSSDPSPLRRALASHFNNFAGVTAPRGDDGPTEYKDTASGIQS